MTQLDLPQISLSRYVDLLKRRRWQVIPVSIFGLVIGGIVAFLIPRYYVATATLSYRPEPGSEQKQNREDPFGALIASAQQSIPLAIEATIRVLGWPEGNVADPYELSENVKAIDDRLTIEPQGDSKNWSFALLRLTYKDRDGKRAADFLNKLVETWRNDEVARTKERVQQIYVGATKRQVEVKNALDGFMVDRNTLVRDYHLEANLRPLEVQALLSEAQQEQMRRETELASVQGEEKALIARLKHKKEALQSMPLKVPSTAIEAKADEASPEVQRITAVIATKMIARSNFRPGRKEIADLDREIAYYQGLLTQMVTAPTADASGMVPNKRREEAQAEISTLEEELKATQARRGVLEAAVAEFQRDLTRRGEGYNAYEKKTAEVERATADLKSASDEVESARKMLGALDNEPTVAIARKAQIPPRPTDPNIALVALLGCLLGLFVATALVLVLDVLQPTYKTVDDVERGLSVPVLGGVSYLETEMQRQQAARARRRATLVAAALLVLVGSVVMIYYYDPTRLPTFVCDLLSMVLGTA